MNKFKVGDKVKRVEGDYCGMRVGDVDIVVATSPSSALVLDRFGKGHDPKMFKLVGFSKSDLKDGDKVRDSLGWHPIYEGSVLMQQTGGKSRYPISLEEYSDTLEYNHNSGGKHDIIEVVRDGVSMFERLPELKEVTLKLTQEQIDSLKQQNII